MSVQQLLIALALAVTGLLVVVIIVGLTQKQLDPTGVATMLGGVLTGIVGSVVLLSRNDRDR